jgi:hypothetical protein
MQTDDVITLLSKSLDPVRRLPSPTALTLRWLALAGAGWRWPCWSWPVPWRWWGCATT